MRRGRASLAIVFATLLWVGVAARCERVRALWEASPDATDAGGSAPTDAARPHAIVLLTLDTTRADHLSGYGYRRTTSPVLDRIAREGVRFESAISPMPTTDPSHLTILTGLYPRTHGSRKNGIPLADPSLPNLATWARGLGYQTAAFISRKHLVPGELDLRGFDWEDGPGAHSRRGDETVTRALSWVASHGTHPFFLWLHLFDPHSPYQPAPPFDRLFASETADRGIPVGEWRYPDPLPPEQVELLVGLYDGEIAYTDRLVERFLDGVESALPAGERPLVVIVGDHGEAMAELFGRYRFAFDHGKYLYQGIIRVPLILRWEGRIPAGRVVSGPVELLDISETLFDLLGQPGFSTQGKSLMPRIRDAGAGGRSAGQSGAGPEMRAFTERRLVSEGEDSAPGPETQFAVQDERHKLILFLPQDRVELYDLAADPAETRDLSGSHTEIRDRLRRDLEDWLATTPRAAKPVPEVPIEKTEALRALGYGE
jgi:arylsulfatase A-like enzyme